MPVDDTPDQRMLRIMEGHSDERLAGLGPRIAVGRRPALAVGLIAGLGLIICAWLALRPAPRAEPLPPRASISGQNAVSPPAIVPAITASAPAPSVSSAVSVYVVGQVRAPGVVSLSSGARVIDAIKAAGGETSRADLSVVNLARRVTDGEQIIVPRPGQPVPGASGASGSSSSKSPGTNPGSGQPVNLNSATEAQLDELPGIGPVIAGRIVSWRQQNGQFTSVSQLGDVSGIGDATLAKLRPLVTV